MKKLPIWTLEIDRCEGLIASVHVSDQNGTWMAMFPGPGMVTKEEEDEVPTEAQALSMARKFVWACGAKPRVERRTRSAS